MVQLKPAVLCHPAHRFALSTHSGDGIQASFHLTADSSGTAAILRRRDAEAGLCQESESLEWHPRQAVIDLLAALWE